MNQNAEKPSLYSQVKRILLLVIILCRISAPVSFSQEKSTGQISISGAFALYPMVVKWTEEYKKINPGVRFDISAGGAGKGISDALNGMVELGMVSREIYPEEMKNGAFPIAVTKDSVVDVVSELNPALNDILKKLSRYYNIEMVITDERLKNETFSGYLDLKNSPEEVLSVINETTSLSYSTDHEKIFINPE